MMMQETFAGRSSAAVEVGARWVPLSPTKESLQGSLERVAVPVEHVEPGESERVAAGDGDTPLARARSLEPRVADGVHCLVVVIPVRVGEARDGRAEDLL